MPIEFDITGAKKAGYSYKEISSYLKDTYNVDFDVEGAKKAGYSDNAIMEYINKTYSDEPRVPRVPKEQTIQNPKEQQVVEAIKGSDAPQNRTPITISDEEIRSIKPHPRISSEEQQVVEAIKESEASQKRSEQSEGVKRILYNNNRYWRVQDKKEAQERGYNSVEDMYKDRESFMVNNYLSENDKQEVQNMLGYINAKKKGDEKSMEAYYRQYLDSRKVNREEYKSKRAELEDLKREIERQISDGLDAELGRKSIEGITKRINDLDLSQKAVINPKEEMNDFIKSNITEVASVSKPSQTPYQKLKEYTNLLYSEVLKRKEELGLDKDMGGIEKYFKDIKLRREAGAGDELEELYSKESKLRTAVKLLYLNRGSQTDENAGNVFVKAFGHSLSPSTKGEFSTNQEAANNLLSIIQESDIAKAVYEEQQKYAEEGAADYKPFSSKWFAQNTAPSAAIMLEYIPAAFLTNAAMGVLGLASKLEKAKEAGVLINGLKGYSNALNKYKVLKTANTIGKEAVKIGAHGVDFAATSEVVSRLFPKEEDEVNAVTGFFGGSSGAATTRGIEAIGLVLQKVFGNKAGVAARVLSDLGSKMKIKDGAAKITIGDILEEFGETFGQIYRDSDNWSEIKSKLNEQFGTLEQKTEFVILTGIMGIGMGKGTAIGKYLYDKSIKEYTSLPRSERAKVDSVLDSVKEAEIELNKEAVKEAPTVDEGNGAEKVDEVNDIKSEDIIEKEDSRSIEEKPTEQSAPITELPTEGEQTNIGANIQTIERKAESESETELNEAVNEADRELESAGVKHKVATIPLNSIIRKPETFQYKASDNKEGTSKNEQIQGEFNPNLAGTLLVWRDENNELGGGKGAIYLADGHHRMELMNRSNVSEANVFFLDAKTAKEAKVEAAKANIAQGRGTSVDAAKVFKEATPEQLDGFKPTSKVAKEGKELAKLNDNIFTLVSNGKLGINEAIAIAQVPKDKQEPFYKEIQKIQKSGAIKMTKEGLMTMAERINEGVVASKTEVENTLFGTDINETLLIAEQAQLEADIKTELAKDARILGNANKNKEVLESAGNVVNTDENAKLSEESKLAAGLYNTFKKYSPIQKILKEATEKLSKTKSTKERSDIKRKAIADVKAEIQRELENVTGKEVKAEQETQTIDNEITNNAVYQLIEKAKVESTAKALEELSKKKKTAATETGTKIVGDEIVEGTDVNSETLGISQKISEGFTKAGEQSKINKSPKALGEWLINNAQTGDRIIVDEDTYWVVERKTDKKGNTEIELQQYFRNENDVFENNPSAVKLFNSKHIGTETAKLATRDASDLFEYSYRNSNGDVVVQQSKYIPASKDNKSISEAYHKAKADDSNPELVKAVEEAIGKNKEPISEPTNKVKGVSSNSNEDNSASRDVESKKADIERRRQEELDRALSDVNELRQADTVYKAQVAIVKATQESSLPKAVDTAGMIIGESVSAKASTDIISVAKRLSDAIEKIQKPQVDKINAKYDAELAELEKQQPPQGKGEGDWSAEQQRIENDKTLSAEQKEKAKIESTAKALKSAIPEKEAFAFAINTLPIEGKINYKDIKQGEYALPFSRWLNKPENLTKDVGSQLAIYNFIKNGGKLPNNTILLNKEGKILDGNNRVKAQLAMGVTDFDYAVSNDKLFEQSNYKTISEAYHKAKKDGSNPELVKAVDDLLGTQKENLKRQSTALEDQIEAFGVPKDDVKATSGLLTKLFEGLKKAGLTAAKNVGEWVGIGKGTEKPYSLKIDGKDTQVKNVQPEVVNGFYSPLEKIITESKFDKLPAKQWAEKYANSEEAKWTGLKDWLAKQQGSVSKADIQQYLKDNRIQVVEVVKTQKDYRDDWDKENDNPKDLTKFSQYQLEGEKENYKEVLVTMPNNSKYQNELNRLSKKYNAEANYKSLRESKATDSELEILRNLNTKGEKFKSSHFDEPNILVHLRMNTRVDAEGNKVLFLEEVQSDWGQKGKKDGFVEKIDKNNIQNVREDENVWVVKFDDGSFLDISKKEAKNADEAKVLALQSKKERFVSRDSKTPTAPFVTDTNAWTKLGLKVALKEAVKQGADKIAWTTGEQQNDRYDLSKQVDVIDAKRNKDGTYEVQADKDGSKIFGKSDMSIKDIEDTFGKDIAQKINDSESRLINISGDNLKAGGKGMKGFYGEPSEGKEGIVGGVAKALVKGLTGKEGKIVKTQFKTGKPEFVEGVPIENADGKEYDQYRKPSTHHSIEITPELRAAVEKGQPLFKEAEAQYRIESGKNIIEAIRDFDGSPRATVALTHEIMHPTVVAIIDGAKEGNEVGKKHAKTIVEEFNKANPNNPITEQELIEGNDAFINGTTTDSYRAVQEFIAEAFEAYLHNGNQGFSKAFQEVLDLIRDAFKAVYNTLTGKEISPELKTMFDEILGGEAEKEKLGKQERKKIAHEKVDNIANLLKGALSVEDKNVKKAGFINQDKIIDLIAQAVKGLISAGIEIDEAISRVRSILEQQYDTSSIKDAQIKEGIENIELEEELKGYGIEDEAAAIGLINKHLKETDKDYTINSTDLKRAISNKRSGKEIEDGKIVTKKDRAFVKKLINKHPRLAESITEKGIKYTVLPDGVTLEEAQSIIDYLGEEMAIREFRNFNNGMPEAVRMAIGQVLIKDLEAIGETNTLLSFIEDFGSRTTDLAQGLRMLGLFKKLGSSTFISMAEKVVEKNREKRSKYDEARLNRLADAIRELQKDSIKKVLELAGVSDKINKIEKIEGGSISVGGARNEKSSYGENNKVVTKKRAEEARKALRGKKLFSGIPPEVIELGIYHIEAGSRAIGEFADAMTKEFGKKVRPYIRTIYEKSIIKLKDNGYKDSDFSSEADIDEYIIKEKASDIKKRINIAVSSGNKLAIKRAIEGIKTLEGSPIQGELLDELREEYKRDKEVIGLLNGGLFLGSDSSVRQAIRRELKDMKESIRDIVMAHYTVQDYVKQSLVEKLVDRAGLDINEATDLVRTIESEFDAMVSSKRSKIISKLTTKREKKKYKVKGIEDKIIEASNLGVLDTKELSDKWADIMGYPNLTEEHRSMIKALSDEVQYSKEGRQKDRALQRLLGYVATIKGIDKVDIGMGIWYANLLSGYTTQFVNFISTFANSMFGLMNLSLQMITHPKRGAFMAKGFYNGMINIGLKDAKEVLLTGYTPIRGGKIEGKDALELKEFKGLLSPLNAFKYVKRFMIATDTLLYAGNKEMRSYLHAIKEASSDESGLEPTQSVLDKAAELLYKDADSYIDAVNQADLEYEQRLDDINESNLPEKEKIREVRQAKRDRNIRVYEIMEQNRDEKVIGDSADYAARATYNYPPEGVLGLFARIANYGKDQLNKFAEEHDSKAGKAAGQSAKILATWVIPFTNIIANVANESLNYFPPVGYGRAARGNTSIFGLFSKKMDAQQRADAYYKAHIGMVAMSSLALYFLLNDDDDDNYIDITANGKGNYIDNYSLRDKGQIPYSIRIGDRYVSYQYTPLFIPLSIIGWMRDKQKYSSEKKVDEGTAIQLVRATQSIVKTLFDMTFVQGLNTFTNQLVNEDMMNEDKLKSMIGRSASTIVKPALVTQSARDLQAILEIPSKDVRGEIAGQLLQDIPVARDMYYNRVNVLGEPVIPNTDKFISKRKPHKIFDALEKLNITIEEPNRRRLIIEDNGVFRYATKEEFYKYSVSRGRSIKERLTELIEDKDRPLMSMDKKDARELVKRVITRITQVESAKIKQK